MNNLHFLFTQKAQIFPNTLSILDGRISLFKRSNSHQWQCRFRLESGSWHQATTGTDELAEATAKAISIYETIRAKISEGFSVKNRTFRQLAIAVAAKLESQIEGRRGRYVLKDFKFVAEKYLIPFFGRYQISELTQDLVNDFESWRRSQMGCEPKASTKRHHASAYNKIIQLADSEGLIIRGKSLPRLNAQGAASEARPAFDTKEIDQLLRFMPDWCQQDKLLIRPEPRILCRAYVEFLLYTGIRHSTESWPLRWRNIEWHWVGGEKYLKIWVSGKTGPRYLIGKSAAIDTLDRLRIWQGLPFDSLDALLEARLDQLIFVYPDKTRPVRIDSAFERLLQHSGLARDSSSRKRTLYSLRHTYATFALADGVDIHTVARQMGTSVLMLEKHYSKLTPMLSAQKLA